MKKKISLHDLSEAIRDLLPNAEILTDGSDSKQLVIYTGLRVDPEFKSNLLSPDYQPLIEC